MYKLIGIIIIIFAVLSACQNETGNITGVSSEPLIKKSPESSMFTATFNHSLDDTTYNNSPRLIIRDTKFDFGITFQHSKITHKFEMHAVGEDTVRIIKVSPG